MNADQQWEVFSNLFYLAPALYAFFHRFFVRAAGYLALLCLSAYHHYAFWEHPAADAEWARAADHVASVWAATVTALLYVPFGAEEHAAERLLGLLALLGGVLAVKLDDVRRDRVAAWEAIVAVGVLALGVRLSYRYHHDPAQHLQQLLTSHSVRECIAFLALLVAAGLLWTLDACSPPLCHGFWHAASAGVLLVSLAVRVHFSPEAPSPGTPAGRPRRSARLAQQAELTRLRPRKGEEEEDEDAAR